MTTETKYFTPDEARRTLPLVKKIVQDILNSAKEMKLLAEDVDGKIGENPEIKKLAEDINGFLAELEEIGCLYKDPNFLSGLVDFPSVINDKEVYLCWRSDEDDILYYHEINEGFSGRKPIPEEYFD